MSRFRLSPEAARDIREIWSYIAADSGRAARSVRLRLFEACALLAANPAIGHTRKVGSFLIIYDPGAIPIGIARVVHGAQDVSRLL